MKRSVLAVLVTLTLLCGIFAPLASAIDTTGFAAEVVRLVNIERAAEGKAALNFGNKKLNDAAMKRAQEYAANPALGHTRPGNKKFETVFAEFNITWTACGENIAEGYTTPAAVVTGWMESEGHRKNIMGGVAENGTPLNFNWIGVAVCEGSDGKLYWAQLFMTGNPADNVNIFTRIINWFRNLWDSFISIFRF